MASSHPPTLITLASRALREDLALPSGAKLLVATSGGSDSTALLHVLSLLAKKCSFSLAAHGVDHGLRPEASAELDQVATFCGSLGVAFSRTVLQVAPGGNLQARARDARRAALTTAAARISATFIATAHHADDRAETVLLRLLRGSGPAGLAVLPAQNGLFIRPLFRARKSDIVAHLQRHRLTFAHDPSNDNPRFLRTQVRHELMPLLERLSPQIAGHLCALADALGSSDLAEPEFTDERGVALVLNRAQRMLVRRARALGQRSARVSLPGGRELSLDPVTLEPLLAAARPRRPRRP